MVEHARHCLAMMMQQHAASTCNSLQPSAHDATTTPTTSNVIVRHQMRRAPHETSRLPQSGVNADRTACPLSAAKTFARDEELESTSQAQVKKQTCIEVHTDGEGISFFERERPSISVGSAKLVLSPVSFIGNYAKYGTRWISVF